MLFLCFVGIKGHLEGGMTYRRRKTDGAYPWTVGSARQGAANMKVIKTQSELNCLLLL